MALLRGINVGGNRKVEMAKLKQTFEKLGFQDVASYINSGNLIFSDGKHSDRELTDQIEKAIEKVFGFRVEVVIRNSSEIAAVVKTLPKDWVNNSDMKCDVLFLWDEVNNKNVLDELKIKPGVDDVKYLPGAIIWRVDRQNIGRSGLLKIVGTPFYKKVTIRNCNTVRKLNELLA